MIKRDSSTKKKLKYFEQRLSKIEATLHLESSLRSLSFLLLFRQFIFLPLGNTFFSCVKRTFEFNRSLLLNTARGENKLCRFCDIYHLMILGAFKLRKSYLQSLSLPLKRYSNLVFSNKINIKHVPKVLKVQMNECHLR